MFFTMMIVIACLMVYKCIEASNRNADDVKNTSGYLAKMIYPVVLYTLCLYVGNATVVFYHTGQWSQSFMSVFWARTLTGYFANVGEDEYASFNTISVAFGFM